MVYDELRALPLLAVVVALLVLGAATAFTSAAGTVAATTTTSTPPDPRDIYSVRQDLIRQRTWILTTDAAYVRDSGGAIRRYEITGWIQAYPPQACAPDLVVEAAGSVLTNGLRLKFCTYADSVIGSPAGAGVVSFTSASSARRAATR